MKALPRAQSRTLRVRLATKASEPNGTSREVVHLGWNRGVRQMASATNRACSCPRGPGSVPGICVSLLRRHQAGGQCSSAGCRAQRKAIVATLWVRPRECRLQGKTAPDSRGLKSLPHFEAVLRRRRKPRPRLRSRQLPLLRRRQLRIVATPRTYVGANNCGDFDRASKFCLAFRRARCRVHQPAGIAANEVRRKRTNRSSIQCVGAGRDNQRSSDFAHGGCSAPIRRPADSIPCAQRGWQGERSSLLTDTVGNRKRVRLEHGSRTTNCQSRELLPM